MLLKHVFQAALKACLISTELLRKSRVPTRFHSDQATMGDHFRGDQLRGDQLRSPRA